MTTAEIINTVCSDMGITRAALAKRMGMLPSSLYRKLDRESMTLKELQQCLDILGVTIAFALQYPDGNTRSAEVDYELLTQELEAAKKTAEFQRKSLRELRSELSSAAGYAELSGRHSVKAEQYLENIQSILSNMDLIIAYALGEDANSEPVAEEPVDFGQLAGKRVLLVDDNGLNRGVLRELLLDYGLVVGEADNGRDAVAAVQAKEPGYYHFLLMDIEMPVMDGYEATMKIRKLPNRIRANIPILALTANAVPESRERAAAVGMDDFLVKPVNTDRLLRSLVKFL